MRCGGIPSEAGWGPGGWNTHCAWLRVGRQEMPSCSRWRQEAPDAWQHPGKRQEAGDAWRNSGGRECLAEQVRPRRAGGRGCLA